MKGSKWIKNNGIELSEIKELGYAKTKLQNINPILF